MPNSETGDREGYWSMYTLLYKGGIYRKVYTRVCLSVYNSGVYPGMSLGCIKVVYTRVCLSGVSNRWFIPGYASRVCLTVGIIPGYASRVCEKNVLYPGMPLGCGETVVNTRVCLSGV